MNSIDLRKMFRLLIVMVVSNNLNVFGSVDINSVIPEIQQKNAGISNISFDYVINYEVSENWINKHANFPKQPEEVSLRNSAFEKTVSTGSAIFLDKKYKISQKKVAVSDNNLFEDKTVIFDGNAVFEINNKDNSAFISSENLISDLMFNPKNFTVLFLDGTPIENFLTSEKTVIHDVNKVLLKKQACYYFDMAQTYMTPEKETKKILKKCWLSIDNNLLIKQGISYSIKDPSKLLSMVKAEFVQLSNGSWYYDTVRFESFPLYGETPDVIAVLTLRNIKINHASQNDFEPDFSSVEMIYDRINNISIPNPDFPPSDK